MQGLLKRHLPFTLYELLALFVIMFVVLTQSGCAGMGVKTFDEKVYLAAETVKQVQVSATTLVRAGKISSADAETVLKATDAAVEGIKVARVYQTTSPSLADNKLQAVLAALTLAQTYLATQGGK